MPRIRKQPVQQKPSSLGLDVASLLAACEGEASLWAEVGKETRLGYERVGKMLKEGWDLAGSAKGTRYHVRAAGLWLMRRDLRKLLREAKKIRKNGINGDEGFAVREMQFGEKLKEAVALVDQIRVFQSQPWSAPVDPVWDRRQVSHKQKAATDEDLKKFYEAAEGSSFLEAFMVAEFSGCRGAEFDKKVTGGVRVEASKINNVLTLSFFIQSAKTDGKKKGIDIRRVDVVCPKTASKEVQMRWLTLAKKATNNKGYFVCAIEPNEKQNAGVRFTNAARFVKKKAGVDVMPYSLRHRVSSQVKTASGGDSMVVAAALGHQTTETQRHYGRAKRGGGGISPVEISGKAVSGEKIRGAPRREGPPAHVKEAVILSKVVPQVAPGPKAGPRLGPRRL